MKLTLKTFAFACAFALILAVPCHAIKITADSGIASSFHIGGVMGFGLGVNFGLDAGIPIGDFELGGEIEQSITDHKFDVSVNITKIGVFLRYEVMPDLLFVGVHTGSMRFTASKDTSYTDFYTGHDVEVAGEDEVKASYTSVSLDLNLGDFTLTPRAYLNFIENGTLQELDVNLGYRF